MRLLRGLLLKPTLNLLSWILRQRNGDSLIIGGPLGWSWQPTLDTTHHGALAGPANAHRHSDLANIGPDNHHARDHATRHQDGGADEIGVAGLSGELADEQKSAFTKVTGRWTLAQAHRGADGKIMVFKGPAADPVEEDKPAGGKSIATGSYTGDGATGRQITTGFKCSLVIIMTTNYMNRFVLIPGITIMDTWAGHNKDKTANTYLHTSDGFVVAVSVNNSNTSGETFYYWAISE